MNDFESCIGEWADRCRERDQTIDILRTQLAEMTTRAETLTGEKASLYKERNQLRDMLDRINAIPDVRDGYHAPNEENIADGVEALVDLAHEREQQVADLTSRLAQVEQEKADLVLRNGLLRDRPDLPIERLEAYTLIEQRMDALISKWEEVEQERDNLKQFNTYNEKFAEQLADRDATIEAQLRESASLNECITSLEQQLSRARQALEQWVQLTDSVQPMEDTIVQGEALLVATKQALREMGGVGVEEPRTTESPCEPPWLRHLRYPEIPCEIPSRTHLKLLICLRNTSVS